MFLADIVTTSLEVAELSGRKAKIERTRRVQADTVATVRAIHEGQRRVRSG